MSGETIVILGAQLLLLLGVVLLWLRKPPADTATQEKLAALQAAIPAELRAELAQRLPELSREISAFAVEQGKLLAGQEKSLLQSLSTSREQAAEHAASLRRDQAANTAEARQALEAVRTTLAEGVGKQGTALAEEMTRTRDLMDARLKELREGNEKKLAEIQASVNEQLAGAVEKQMNESFNRVIDQFTAVQKAMGDVQAVTAQIGDIKRLFGNVKTRGGWGETQVKAMLDDILPEGSYEVNVRLREGSSDAVEFCVVMPVQGSERVLLPVDAKFPVEDFERLLAAWEAADPVAETAARKSLELRIRSEAQKIAQKYICPPRTVEFGVMYLPTEGLYAEVARIPGLIDDIGRNHRVLVLGPTLLPALLRTIQLGHVTLALSKNAEGVKDLLAATKSEMQKMDDVLGSLSKQVGTVTTTIGKAQTRTRAIARKLRGVDAMPDEAARALIGVDEGPDEENEAP
ncbi:DNA recombination protein RmuC [Rhodovarius crocodyli]|uniref:DNA recombination protein RmuC homolog n=1 Tax=Rhodovarius crocodyli TaxID=1979269 RepID=A0A437MN41_9PROT|nr:DNA recombination protein RmuC [Rhodovarius crocodyli]RVT99042.1 DNA recombination protein RmuC [Rhodovarius crocodyli]